MDAIKIEVRRGEEWRHLQTIAYDPTAKSNKRRGDKTEYCRAGAIKAAHLATADWQASDQFIGCGFRLTENAGYGLGVVTVRS